MNKKKTLKTMQFHSYQQTLAVGYNLKDSFSEAHFRGLN